MSLDPNLRRLVVVSVGVILLASLKACGGGGSAPVVVVPDRSAQDVVGGVVQQGIVNLATPLSGYAVQFRIDLDEADAPEFIEIGGAKFIRFSNPVVAGQASYGVDVAGSLATFEGIQPLRVNESTETESGLDPEAIRIRISWVL